MLDAAGAVIARLEAVALRWLLQNSESIVYVTDQLGHHSIKVTVDVYGHLVPGANKAAVDRLDQQALAALAALEARNPAQPPRNLEPVEHTRGVTDRSVTPRQDLVELRGLELERSASGPVEDDILPLPASHRSSRNSRDQGGSTAPCSPPPSSSNP